MNVETSFVWNFFEIHPTHPVLFVIRVSHHITKCDVIIVHEYPVSPSSAQSSPCVVVFSRNHCIPVHVVMFTN